MIVAVPAFIVDVVDASIGIDYGTILALVLLMAGFDPHKTVPAVLMHASQLIGGSLASSFTINSRT